MQILDTRGELFETREHGDTRKYVDTRVEYVDTRLEHVDTRYQILEQNNYILDTKVEHVDTNY